MFKRKDGKKPKIKTQIGRGQRGLSAATKRRQRKQALKRKKLLEAGDKTTTDKNGGDAATSSSTDVQRDRSSEPQLEPPSSVPKKKQKTAVKKKTTSAPQQRRRGTKRAARKPTEQDPNDNEEYHVVSSSLKQNASRRLVYASYFLWALDCPPESEWEGIDGAISSCCNMFKVESGSRSVVRRVFRELADCAREGRPFLSTQKKGSGGHNILIESGSVEEQILDPRRCEAVVS